MYFNDTSHPDYRSKTYWDVSRWKTQLQYSHFSIKILGISIEKIGFSFEILGLSKICDNWIPYLRQIFVGKHNGSDNSEIGY